MTGIVRDVLWAVWGVFILAIAMNANAAADAPATRPSSLTAKIGEITLRIDGPKMWTLSGFSWQGVQMAVEDSAYGTVITYPNDQHLGTAHFLDVPGRPGEVEKEQVTDLRFYIDGRPLTDLKDVMSVEGKSFRMERISKIRTFDVDSLLTVEDGKLVQSARIRTNQPVPLQGSYPLMFAWTPTATEYLFGGGENGEVSGEFVQAPAKPGEGVQKSATWMAVYDGPTGKGAVACVLARPKDADAWLQYTDAPGIYRKLRLMTFAGATVPAGFDGTYRMAIGFFNADKGDWKAKAREKGEELRGNAQ